MGSVSVIIPCFMYGHYLRGCVESVLDQEGVDVRVLIVDDASPDMTPEVAAELMVRDGRVEYTRHASNIGHIATYNEGLEWASGDYTLLLSADDLLTPGALLRAVRLMDAHPEVGLVYGRVIRFKTDEPPPQIRTASESEWQIWDGFDWLETKCKESYNRIVSPEVLVRTRLQRELGGYRKELPHTADMEMWMRFAAHAPVGILDADQAFYRLHEQNMHLRAVRDVLYEFESLKKAFDTLFYHYGYRIPERERMHSLAGTAIASNALGVALSAFYKEDVQSCRKLVDLAVRACPDTRSWGQCRRLNLMLRIGPRAWKILEGVKWKLRNEGFSGLLHAVAKRAMGKRIRHIKLAEHAVQGRP